MRACHKWTQTLSKSQGNPVHIQNYRRLMFGCQKGKNGWETTEKIDWLKRENIIFLWLGIVLKNHESIEWKQVDGNVICLKKVKLELGLKNEDPGQIYG